LERRLDSAYAQKSRTVADAPAMTSAPVNRPGGGGVIHRPFDHDLEHAADTHIHPSFICRRIKTATQPAEGAAGVL